MHLKLHPFSKILLFFGLVLATVILLDCMNQYVLQRDAFFYEKAFTNFRNQEITQDELTCLRKESGTGKVDFYELLTMYYANDNNLEAPEKLKEQVLFAKKYQSASFLKLEQAVESVWADVSVFPVGEVESNPDASVFFCNSWMQSRTYGGKRGHEGCDIMASVNERGIYPVYSMTDGVIEKIGWLPKGGYRIGVRSPSGGYFYYAHLAEYAKDFTVGEKVEAGSLLGLMGDTGYSEIEGTTGNFDVHLHVGIYVTIEGEEVSVNAYPVLAELADGMDFVELK